MAAVSGHQRVRIAEDGSGWAPGPAPLLWPA